MKSLCLAAALLAASACVSADVIVGTRFAPDLTHLGAPTATRLVHAPDGLGHILILPYFTAHAGNATLISITNAAPQGKALKVRVRGGASGDTLLQWILLLAPGDVWTASITEGAGGIAGVTTSDDSCTLPRLQPGVMQAFATNRLDPLLSAADKASQTREGYVEVLNMADISSTQSAQGYKPLFQAIRPASSGTAPSCSEAVLNEAIVINNHQTEAAATAPGFEGPTGGLSGRWTILNVPQTTTFAGTMKAIRAAEPGGASGRANFALFPPTAQQHAGGPQLTADPLLRGSAYTSKREDGQTDGLVAGPRIAPSMLDLPDLSTPYILATGPTAAQTQAAALMEALTAPNLQNDFAKDAAIGARTDWVLAMPARRYSVGIDYGPAGSRVLYSVVPPTGTQYFHDGIRYQRPQYAGRYCTAPTGYAFADRRGATWVTWPVSATPSDPAFIFCNALTVLGFNGAGQSVLGASALRQQVDVAGAENGWGAVGFSNSSFNPGLPVWGTSFLKATNPVAGAGYSGTYGVATEHLAGQ